MSLRDNVGIDHNERSLRSLILLRKIALIGRKPESPLSILYEDNHLLVVAKPAGLPTMGVAADRPSLLERARAYIKQRYDKPGNVYLGAMSRLDAPVSGVVLFARTSKAAARLTEQFRERTVDKRYWALVVGHPPEQSDCVDWLAPDDRHRRVGLAAAGAENSQEARLSFRRIHQGPDWARLEVHLHTGRKHQIRVQLSSRGWPILGDRKYGSQRTFADGIGLHARQLTFTHPTTGESILVEAAPPPAWRHYLAP